MLETAKGPVGMLWLDDDKKRPLPEKIKRAIEYYENKHGKKPVEVHVNKRAIVSEFTVGNIPVKAGDVQMHHMWLMMEPVS